MYVPPSCTRAPAPRAASAIACATAVQIGSANETWPTMPSPKNVSGRWRVRAMNWAGKARSVAVDELVGKDEVGRPVHLLHRADRAGGEDRLHAEELEAEDVRAVVDL